TWRAAGACLRSSIVGCWAATAEQKAAPARPATMTSHCDFTIMRWMSISSLSERLCFGKHTWAQRRNQDDARRRMKSVAKGLLEMPGGGTYRGGEAADARRRRRLKSKRRPVP